MDLGCINVIYVFCVETYGFNIMDLNDGCYIMFDVYFIFLDVDDTFSHSLGGRLPEIILSKIKLMFITRNVRMFISFSSFGLKKFVDTFVFGTFKQCNFCRCIHIYYVHYIEN